MSKVTLLIAVFAGVALASPTHAEPVKPATPATHAAACKALYELHDLNMEIHYDKKASAKERQIAFVAGEKALSDFRKAGCKYKDVQQ